MSVFLPGHDGREPIGERLRALPGHRREDRARSCKGQRCYSDAMTASPMAAGARPARRRLPSIDQLLQSPAVRALEARYGRSLVPREARRLRRRGAGARGRRATPPASDAALADLAARLAGAPASPRSRRPCVRVINATGVVIHTNLGRAPLPAAAARAGRGGGVRLLEPRARPRDRRARRARGARRGAPARAAGRGGDGGGQQQRGRGAAGREHLRRGPRGRW